MTFTIRKPDGQTTVISVNTPAEGFEAAERLNSRSLRDQCGERFIYIEGEWYGL